MNELNVERVRILTERLNQYRNEYYNLDAPTVSDEVYDRLFDELMRLEKETGIVMGNSPTQTAGYPSVSSLKKTTHARPLLSLEKTKHISEIIKFISGFVILLMLKLDGLTVKLEYENGLLIRASTRGDGYEGDDITHNTAAISGIPAVIPTKEKLVVTGEAYIPKTVFEKLKELLLDSTGKKYKNARNMASGSVRLHNSAECAKRGVRFMVFNVLEGAKNAALNADDSKTVKLSRLPKWGFTICKHQMLQNPQESDLKLQIDKLVEYANKQDIPIDGLVATFDSIALSKKQGSTGHHYKDGMAFKFKDDLYETVLQEIVGVPSRTGEITPVAIFDTVEIDGCDVSKASLHNLTFIKRLELAPGCRILVSKRNMIIPQVEANLDMGKSKYIIPEVCPCCGFPTRVETSENDKKEVVETLFCDNVQCVSRILRKFVHFTGKKAMNVEGLSEVALKIFIDKGWLHSFTDIYRLNEHEDEICAIPGFGEKSWNKLWNAIQKSRNTTFERFLIAMDIPMIGNSASRKLGHLFWSDVSAFRAVVEDGYDFTVLEDFGDVLNENIHKWFKVEENKKLWEELKEMTEIEKKEIKTEVADNPFRGKTIVVTGTLDNFTRHTIEAEIESLGAKASKSVSKNTDYLLCGSGAGSKLDKANALGVPVITEMDFCEMAKSA